MTTYSVMGTGERVVVMATWATLDSGKSVKITTVNAREAGDELAWVLTVTSEATWYAAAWLDTWPVLRAHLSAVAEWARAPQLAQETPNLDLEDCRHQFADPMYDAWEVLHTFLAAAIRDLSHTQRLAVADEVLTELWEMDEALVRGDRGEEPAPESRGWQFGHVTATQRYGLASSLADGACTWAALAFRALTPGEVWAARGHLLRLDQMAAAAAASGFATNTLGDCREIEIRVRLGEPGVDVQTVVVEPLHMENDYWRLLAGKPMTVRMLGSRDQRVLGEVDPYDSDGFVKLLGDWVLAVPFRG